MGVPIEMTVSQSFVAAPAGAGNPPVDDIKPVALIHNPKLTGVIVPVWEGLPLIAVAGLLPTMVLYSDGSTSPWDGSEEAH